MMLEINEMRVRPGAEAEFERLYFAQRQTSDDGAGPRSSRLYRRLDRPGEYAVVLEWDSLEADVAGEAAPDRKASRQALFELVEERTRKARFDEVEPVRRPDVER